LSYLSALESASTQVHTSRKNRVVRIDKHNPVSNV